MIKVNLEIIKKEMISDLNRYNIHLLREQGSKLGVKSVTTHKKEKLVELIVEKKLANRLVSKPEDDLGHQSVVSLAEKEMLLEHFHDDMSSDGEIVSGVVELCENIDGFLRVSGYRITADDVFITQGIINECKIKYGDHIVGKAIKLTSTEARGLTAVLSINGQKPESLVRTDFLDIAACPSHERITLGQNGDTVLSMMDIFAPIAIGDRSMIFSKAFIRETSKLVEIVRAFEQRNIKVSALFLSEKPETISYLKNMLGDVLVATDSGASHRSNERTARLCLERLKREAESGRNTALVVGNIGALNYSENAFERGKDFDFSILFGSGRKLVSGGSLTVVAFSYIMGERGSRIFETLYPLANSVTIIDSDGLRFNAPSFNIRESFSTYFERDEGYCEIRNKVAEFVTASGTTDERKIIGYHKSILK